MEMEYTQVQETPDFMTDVTINMLKENLLYQFKFPGWTKVDYFKQFLDSYEYSRQSLEEDGDDDEKGELEENRDDFLAFMTELFQSVLHIGFAHVLEIQSEEQLDLLHFAYRYFILGIRDNWLAYVRTRLNHDSAKISESLEGRKDITSMTFKHELDELDVKLISNLSTIVANLVDDEEMLIDDFLELGVGDDFKTEAEILSEAFDTYEITGNFCPQYQKMLDDAMRIDIEAVIRADILTKYRSTKGQTENG